MAQEINLGGTIYVSSKRAAEITGYAQDYIGQLARSGQIEARRVAGLWYVLEESLGSHMQKAGEYVPTPPVRSTAPAPTVEASVSFDGKEYISASRAAKITGYSQDYVGQLARSGKVPSRQVGNRWYVDRSAITEHKRHNDDLLGAVQAESVGVMRSPESLKNDAGAMEVEKPHFSYIAEEAPVLPIPEAMEETPIEALAETPVIEEVDEEEEEQQIPIRVVPQKAPPVTAIEDEFVPHARVATAAASSRMTMFFIAFLGIAIFGAGVATFIHVPGSVAPSAVLSSATLPEMSVASSRIDQTADAISAVAGKILSKEIEYHRSN